MQKFNIAFFSSSDFCIPIAQNIMQNSGRTLLKIYSDQVIALKVKNEYSIVFPEHFDIDDIPELDLPIELVLVVSQPDSVNRGKLTPNPISKWARDNNCNLFTPNSFNRSRNELETKIDIAITASFGQIISDDSLVWSKNGFVNWHPSLLPLYRGATPMQSSIKNGDIESGLSWINMTKELDEGDVFLQFKTNIENDNFQTLSQRLGELGARTWAIAIVNKLINKKLKQDSSKVSFCGKLTKDDRIVNPTDQTAKQIFDQYKAFNSFPGTSFVDEYFAGEVKIVECFLPIANPTDIQSESKNQSTDNNEASSEKYLFLRGETEGFGVVLTTTKFHDWLDIKENKQQKVYLICKDNSLLEITRIKLSSGKQINLSGYQFKIK